MNGWYLRRGEAQTGPYTPEDLVTLDMQGQLFEGDLFYDPASGAWLTLAQARSAWQPSQKKMKKPRKKRGCLITLLAIVAVIAGAALFFALTKTSDNMTLGRRQQAVRQTVEPSGGTVRVDAPDSPANGLEIQVPEGAYDKNTNFKISTREIEKHRFGPRFTPLTPLITVDNGHGFSEETMIVKIPINLPEDSFAMAFYYDEKTGKLEGLPLVSLSDTELVVATHHFSDVLAASVKKSDLQNLEIDTGFRPGLDDWHFVNRGSWLSPGGHCAGQTVSAMWYYYERHLSRGERRLYGLFDNNRYGYNTKSFWQDDSHAYRFASMTQYRINWDSRMRSITTSMGGLGDHLTLYAFQFSMMMTGEPQYISVSTTTTDSEGNSKRLGHAVIAYRIEGNRIYTADPNYPGAEKVMTYQGSGFNPYSSGLNAEDIAASGTIAFDTIRYMAKSSMIDWNMMGELYKEMLNGTIGNDIFPKITYEIATSYNPETNTYTWAPCPDVLKTDEETTAKVHENLRGKIVIKVKSGYSDQYSTAYSGLTPVGILLTKRNAPTGEIIYSITPRKGENHYGFLTEFRVDGRDRYCDFRRVKVVYEQQGELEFTQDEYDAFAKLETEFTALSRGTPPDTEYVWNFGDRTPEVRTDKPTAVHVFDQEGSYSVKLKAVSKTDNKLYAETMTTVDVTDLTGTWKLDYTIEESAAVDSIVNFFLKGIINFINMIFDTEVNPDDVEFTLTGTVIGCELAVSAPETPNNNTLDIRLTQKTSSHEYVEVSTDPWYGILTIQDGKVKLDFIVTEDEGTFAIKFNGRLDSGSIWGDFNAVVYSGSFRARK